ncbi:GH25 family lysozyme [Lachnospiraceae bacterium 62-26]
MMKRMLTLLLIAALMVTGVNVSSIQAYATNENVVKEGEENEAGFSEDKMDEEEDFPASEGEKTDLDESADTSNGDIEEPDEKLDGSPDEKLDSPPEVIDVDPEIEDCANSWRYEDGELIDLEEGNAMRRNRSAYHPNATRKGIDVSHHQGEINWEKVKASGIEFALIRCGYGSDFTSQDDRYWLRNVSECERLGIPYGVYLYSYAKNTQEALSEARHVLRLIKGHKLSYPVYFDMEDDSTIGSDFGAIAEVFCSTIQNAGYAVGVYANLDWWTNRLTDSRFSNWYRWVAQYNTSCGYTGDYAIWQYTSSGSVSGISGKVDMNYLIGYPSDHGIPMAVKVPASVKNAIRYSAHVENTGWMQSVKNGNVAGTVGMNRKLEAFEIKVQDLPGVNVEYCAYVDGNWQNYVSNGNVAGTIGQNKPAEIIKVKLTGENAKNYNIYYRVYVNSVGWMGWTSNDEPAGTLGYNDPIEAYQIALLPAGEKAPGTTENSFKQRSASVRYEAHVQDIGWQAQVKDGDTAGTTGRNLKVEALKIKLADLEYEGYEGSVEYCGLVEDSGWQNYALDGNIIGTVGENKKLEAVAMRLKGNVSDHYDIYYRVHTSDIGWQGWAKNDEKAGTEGFGKKIEAVEIRLVRKGENAPGSTENAYQKKPVSVRYSAHVQDIGWQKQVENGVAAGTTGQNKKVEALKIQLSNLEVDGSIEYRANVEGIGWQAYVPNGEVAGTTGQNKKIEAVSIQLKGGIAQQYSVFYRVHSSDIGWQGWAKDGENAGTLGMGKKIEAIEVRLVKKGEQAPGSTNNAFMEQTVGIRYSAHVQDIGWQKYVSDGALSGTVGRNKQLEALKIQLTNKKYNGDIQYKAHVEDIGWQPYVGADKIAGTVGKNKHVEAVAIQLTGEMKNHYDIYYRVHSSDFGWLGWAKNGELAGSEGFAKQMEAVEIRLIEKGGKAPGSTQNAFKKNR